MASKKRKNTNKKKLQAKPDPQQLKAVERLWNKGEAGQAINRLEMLIKQYPKFSVLYLQGIEFYTDTDNAAKAAWTALRWTQNSPNSMAAWLNLFECTVNSGHIAIAHNAQQNYNDLAEQQSEALIEEPSPETFVDMIMSKSVAHPEPDSMEDALIFDIGRLLLDARQWAAAVPYLESMQQYPPAANNYALVLFQQGKTQEAMQAYQGAFNNDPENLFALSGYIRLLVWHGHLEEANKLADKIKELEPSRPLYADAQLTALAFLGRFDDAFACYQRLSDDKIDDMEPIFYHLAGSVAYIAGDRSTARTLWEKIPSEAYYRGENEDPVNLLQLSGRNSRNPALFSHTELLPLQWVDVMQTIPGRFNEDKQQFAAIKQELAPYPSPDYLRLCYEAIDDFGVSLIELMLIARARDGSEVEKQLLLECLKSHRTELNNKVTLSQRLQTAGIVGKDESVNYWTGEELSELQNYSFEISREPKETQLTEADMEHYTTALDMLRSRNIAAAREILAQLVKRYPDDETLRGNIAASWELEDEQKAVEEYEAIIKDFPDYLFARCMLAKSRILAGRLEEVGKLLDGLLAREKLHISEYIQILGVTALLQAAKGEEEAAQSQLDMARNVVEFEDEEKNLQQWQYAVDKMLGS